MAELTNSEQPISPDKKPELYKKAIKHLVFASLALAGCGPVEGKNVEAEVMKTLSSESVELPTENEFDITGLNSAKIEAGDSIVTAIDRFHGNEGEYNAYTDMGLVVLRNGEPEMYFQNKLGIDYSGLLGNVAGLQPGDEIAWGKTNEVALKVRGADNQMLTISGNRLNCSLDTGQCMDQLQAFGGSLESPVVFFHMEGKTSGWDANVGNQTYDDPAEALQVALSPKQ